MACVFAAPVVTRLASANAAQSGGGSLTIRGLNLGAVNPSPTVSLTAADVCGSSAWTSATTLACAPEAYGGSLVTTTLTVSAVAGTVTGRFSFDGAMRRAAPRCDGWLVQTDASMQRPSRPRHRPMLRKAAAALSPLAG